MLDDKILRFLDGESMEGEKVSYSTYQRSGNTFLRKYIELISGIPTGSEMYPYQVFPLYMHGLIGEYTVDDSVWIVKSHDPIGDLIQNFHCNKMIVTFRNPFDSIVSLMNLIYAKSHQMAISNDIPKEDPQFWDSRVKQYVDLQVGFYKHVFEILKENKIPMFLLKFEELLDSPRENLH